MKAIVTGGAGFIGSHLVDALIRRGDEVTIIDNLSTGALRHIAGHIESGATRFCQQDLLKDGWQEAFRGADRVYHIAADPDVRASSENPGRIYAQNVTATIRVLEAMRESGCNEVAFTSTSTVYGEADIIPTPEEYPRMEPISIYGGTKLACEAMISSYAHSYDWRSWVFRFANIIGERSNHGVIWDFIHKLLQDPCTLEILGDGTQAKSYCSVTTCVDAVLFAVEHTNEPFACFNIGSEDWIDVTSIASIVAGEMGLRDVVFRYTGGDRGWVGDVPRMLLSVEKLKSLGWRPIETSEEAVRAAARALIRETGVHP
ncbi:MAG TPA: NAD-dependent epimerase/dehydratase family protein [Methanoregulaceae archaeon]|nr:MAG: NAD-dependent epimerase/dehydratase family protein [Methanolinea sp.]HON81532.1 NAD-dependent epimerase/dehydratase family protein [Methanoregulaceae archaeon]HPD10338.1 NAD-dependent epimerase/dehydratase family protein [Methanoregulaceae archaeon]HRT15432.1 NAD-dependent epimerase/dehydratase family protein [Methanoregulaceae archaeon]HRU30905.1 NAD-dependent epimerase/dehydratase family protein [Methanoregulaceae archaeon]